LVQGTDVHETYGVVPRGVGIGDHIAVRVEGLQLSSGFCWLGSNSA
jgi:hypothetical protein